MSDINVNLRPAWRNYWAGFMVVALLLAVCITTLINVSNSQANLGAGGLVLLALLMLIVIAFKRFSWKFSIRHDRVLRHYGIIARNQQSVRIKDLRSVELNQSLLQRLLGVGNLAFYSAGSATAEVRFHGIKKPLQWRDTIDRVVDELKDN